MISLHSRVKFINEISGRKFELQQVSPGEYVLWDSSSEDQETILYASWEEMEAYLEAIKLGIQIMIDKYYNRQMEVVGGVLSALAEQNK